MKNLKLLFILFVVCLAFSTSTWGQSLTEVILPQYIQGRATTNNERVPFAFRVTLSSLTPNATYRYFNQVVTSADGPGVNGAGNPIFVKQTGDFVRTTTVSLGTAGQYGEFTTDGSGSYTGWFITEPTGNVRFTPGNQIYMRIMLNDGAGGTSVATRLTTTNFVKVLRFLTTSTDSSGTGIRGNSDATPKNFVMLYDNTDGTGRPITGTFVESDGTTGGGSYVSFYQTNVQDTTGAWGAIIPNQLPNGIRRIESRKLSDGSVDYFATDADGVWPSGANTVNPTGGTTPVVITSSDAILPIQLASFTGYYVGNSVKLEWSTISEVNNLGFYIERRVEGSHLYSRISELIQGAGTTLEPRDYSWTDVNVSNGIYYYHLVQVDFDGTEHPSHDIVVVVTGTLGVGNSDIPTSFSLGQNYPNPFNPVTTIKFTVQDSRYTTLKVYNTIGIEVATLFSGNAEAGKIYNVSFDASNFSSGLYIYKLQSGNLVDVKKMALVR